VATDLTLVILDRGTRAVVCSRWLGGNGTLEVVQRTLRAGPNFSTRGLDCWTKLTSQDLEQVATASCFQGGTPTEIATLAELFPSERFTWMLVRDY
jgi:hypothetical protein